MGLCLSQRIEPLGVEGLGGILHMSFTKISNLQMRVGEEVKIKKMFDGLGLRHVMRTFFEEETLS